MRIFNALSMLGLALFMSTAQAESLNIQQVLQRVVDHYPSIKTAALQVQKAQQENIKVESQLSWLLNGNAGYSRETSLFGTATDRYTLGSSVNRNLSNGGTFGLNANISRDDAEDTFAPSVPNPATKTRIDINYRHRLLKGQGNPDYEEAIKSANAAADIAQSEKLKLYDSLAEQVIELYLSASTTQARIKSIDKTIERGLRLKKYIQSEFKLGLSEEKDVLQVNARLSINEADKKSLQVAWQQQVISLNRLMGRPWDADLTIDASIDKSVAKSFNEVYASSTVHSPGLKRIESDLLLAESAIRVNRDQRKDELDLVLYLGNELNQGDTLSNDLDESEVVGGVSLEFRRGLDKSGLNASLRQAHFDRGIALQEKKQLLEDLQYDVASLLSEVSSSEQALEAFGRSVNAEQKKLNEATKRYRDGRIETDRIIEFESQLAVSELSYDLQSIELLRRLHKINLLRGDVWKNIILPEFAFDEYTTERLN